MEDYVLKKSIGAITKYPSNPTTGVGNNAPHILIKENDQLNLYVRGTANDGEMYKFSFDENNFERIPEYDSYKRFAYSIKAYQNGKIFYVGGLMEEKNVQSILTVRLIILVGWRNCKILKLLMYVLCKILFSIILDSF